MIFLSTMNGGNRARKQQGFTLIELSIVLVIIGLIVAAILTGQDMIKASEIRATVGQVEKYNSAVNTFRTKYNGIPGDILYTQSSNFGLFSETSVAGGGLGGGAGHQDGNGLLEGAAAAVVASGAGETLDFWRHLSDANLVDGLLGTSGNSAIVSTTGLPTGAVTIADQSFPPSRMNPVQHFIVLSVSGFNYYEMMPVSGITAAGTYTFGTTGITPINAYNIDIKLDDGNPNTGVVTAQSTGAVNTAASVSAGSYLGMCDVGTGIASDTYNRNTASGGNSNSCAVRFRFN